MAVQIRRRKWRWVGHTLRKAHTNVTRQALEWNPQGNRKRGRPRQTWRQSLLEELKTAGMSWRLLNQQPGTGQSGRLWSRLYAPQGVKRTKICPQEFMHAMVEAFSLTIISGGIGAGTRLLNAVVLAQLRNNIRFETTPLI